MSLRFMLTSILTYPNTKLQIHPQTLLITTLKCFPAPPAVTIPVNCSCRSILPRPETLEMFTTYLFLLHPTLNLLADPFGSTYKTHFTSDYYSPLPSPPPWTSHRDSPAPLSSLPNWPPCLHLTWKSGF